MIWYKNNTSDIIISTRIRLARNIADCPFPNALSDKAAVSERIKKAVSESAIGKDMEFFDLSAMDPKRRRALAEEHLISFDMLKGAGKAYMVSADKTMSIMLMEEDHLRIQVIRPGECLDEAWSAANAADDAIEQKLDYAFDEEFGYLTACPTNTGTGLRASVMMHLPALSAAGSMQSIISSASSLGIAVRGMYGEGSEAKGCMYQISNQVTSGISEEDIIAAVKNVAGQIENAEKKARESLMKKNGSAVADKLWRSYGTLKYARMISSDEAKALLSDVMLGQNMGIIPNENKMSLVEAVVMTEPAVISGSEELSPEERDKKRAEVLRSLI